MKTDSVSLGICKDARCTGAGFGPVERYDGPGMFCPNCGELLQVYVPDATPIAAESAMPPAGPRPSAFAAESRQEADIRAAPVLPKNEEPRAASAPPSRGRSRVRRLLVGTAVIAVAAVVSAVAASGLMDRSHAATFPTVGVCGSSLTGRLARDIAGAYSAQPQARFKSFELRSAHCDVRFFTALDEPNRSEGGLPSAVGGLIARDGIVAIVNPQNPIASLSMDQLRGIFTGATHDWAQLGAAKEPISVYLPDATTDESRIVTAELLKGAPVGSTVIRVGSSGDVVRAVAAANGRNAIGMVAFSGAEPGKVLAIQHFPPPSILSISEQRYPMVLGVRAAVAPGALLQFLMYSTSNSAKAVAVRDGFVL